MIQFVTNVTHTHQIWLGGSWQVRITRSWTTASEAPSSTTETLTTLAGMTPSTLRAGEPLSSDWSMCHIIISDWSMCHITFSDWPGTMEVPAWLQWWYGWAQLRREGGRCLTGPGSLRSRGQAPPWSGGTLGVTGAWTAGIITWAAPWSGATSG